MKKAFLVILVLTFIFVSCDNDGMNKQEQEENPYPDGVYPFEVSNVDVVNVYGDITLTWDNPDDKGFSHVIVELYTFTDSTLSYEFQVYPWPDNIRQPGNADNPSLEKNSFSFFSGLAYLSSVIKCVDKFGNISTGVRNDDINNRFDSGE